MNKETIRILEEISSHDCDLKSCLKCINLFHDLNDMIDKEVNQSKPIKRSV